MKVVLVYSGGLDSTVLLYHLLDEGHDVTAVSINYGQRHRCELSVATEIAGRLGISHQVVDLSGLRPILAGSSLTDEVDVPEGHYEAESMKLTVVPNRNMIFLSVATALAISTRADWVAYAAHSGDHAIYPDCREAFAGAMDQAIRLADWHEVRLMRPFVGMTKADIVRRGDLLGAPMKETWSCYQGQSLHCGRCGTCIERREAFYLAGVEDETEYDSAAPSVEAMAKADWRI